MKLIPYSKPGRAKILDPAMISVDAPSEFVDEFVDHRVSKLIDMIRYTFLANGHSMVNPT